jgi:hypothetical protein
MTTVCLHVKPTAFDPGIGLMSVTLHGPRWTGERLRLGRPGDHGLPHSDVVGWSDFYGGGPCQVHVACASSGSESGYLVWGGTLGLRVLPADLPEVDRQLGDVLESRSVLWVRDVSALPAVVRQVVEVSDVGSAEVVAAGSGRNGQRVDGLRPYGLLAETTGSRALQGEPLADMGNDRFT